MKTGKVALNTSEGHLGGYAIGGDPATWYPELWNWIAAGLGVESVLDVGCGEGHSTRYFKELGCDALGIDGSARAIRDSVGRDWVTRHDFCDGPYVPNRSFDMIWACEFVEHVDEAFARNYLETFGFADRYIFMTHALPGQKGWHHVNCQPRAYWITVISEIGFRFSPGLTLAARVKADGHFRNSGLVFVKHGFHLPLGARMGAAVLFPDVVMHLLGKLSRSVADSIARGITPYLQGR